MLCCVYVLVFCVCVCVCVCVCACVFVYVCVRARNGVRAMYKQASDSITVPHLGKRVLVRDVVHKHSAV